MQVGHNNYSSSYPLKYSIGGPSRADAVPRLAALAPVENYQDYSAMFQTQIKVPEVDTEIEEEDGNPTSPKLFVDVEDVAEPLMEQIFFAN